jgi:hypothetical protein
MAVCDGRGSGDVTSSGGRGRWGGRRFDRLEWPRAEVAEWPNSSRLLSVRLLLDTVVSAEGNLNLVARIVTRPARRNGR